MIKSFSLYFFILIALTAKTFSQSNTDVSVELSALVQKSPARITLNWVANDSATAHIVYRKLKSGNSWVTNIEHLNPAVYILSCTFNNLDVNMLFVIH